MSFRLQVTKQKFEEQYKKALARVAKLREMGKTDDEIQTMLAEEKKYCVSVLSKLFHKSGKRIGRKVEAEDVELAKQTFTERKDSRKPIREKEIEDAAWFHNLLHDLGKYVYHKMVQYVEWTDEDMSNYEHACKTLTGFVDGIHTLIEDGGKVQRLEDEKTLLELKLIECQIVLDVAVEKVKLLSWYNDMLIGCMTPESRLRALNQMFVATAMKTMTEKDDSHASVD